MNEKVAIYIIVPNSFKEILLEELKASNFKCTFLSATGMYLRKGQTTCLIITESSNTAALKRLCGKIKSKYKSIENNEDNFMLFSVPVVDFTLI